MKSTIFLASYLALFAVHAQEVDLPPAKTSVVTTQKVGDLIIQSTVTPTWYVPNGAAIAIPAGQPNMTKPPVRPLAPLPVAEQQIQQAPAVASSTASPSPAQIPTTQVTTVVVTQPMVRAGTSDTPKSSSDWKQRIDALTGDLETNKLALDEAQAKMIIAAEEEKRIAEQQFAAAQRRLDATRKHAEKVANDAASLKGAASAAISSETVIKPEPKVASIAATEIQPTFILRRQDRTIPAALTRWAEEAGFTLLWEAKDDPASYEQTYRKPFPDAVDDVIRDLRLAGRDVRMCEYMNRVIRIVPSEAACKIPLTIEKSTIQVGATE